MPNSDGKDRPVCIPAKVQANIAQKKYITKLRDENPDAELEVDIEEREDYFYTVDYNKSKDLENPEWKTDKIPRFYNGKNIADFVTEDFETVSYFTLNYIACFMYSKLLYFRLYGSLFPLIVSYFTLGYMAACFMYSKLLYIKLYGSLVPLIVSYFTLGYMAVYFL